MGNDVPENNKDVGVVKDAVIGKEVCDVSKLEAVGIKVEVIGDVTIFLAGEVVIHLAWCDGCADVLVLGNGEASVEIDVIFIGIDVGNDLIAVAGNEVRTDMGADETDGNAEGGDDGLGSKVADEGVDVNAKGVAVCVEGVINGIEVAIDDIEVDTDVPVICKPTDVVKEDSDVVFD